MGDLRATDGLRVLLVEDNDEIAELVAMMLEMLGHRATRAQGVADAVRLIASEPCDVIVSDYRLRDGSAIDLLRQVRTALPGPSSPGAVVLTAYDRASVRLPPEAGAAAVLEKPVTSEELQAAIAAAVGGQSPPPPLLPHPRASVL